jgi:hypothetical protein
MYKTLTHIDLFGYTPHMQIGKNKKFRTVYGGLVTLIIYFFLGFFSLLSIKEHIFKESPKFYYSHKYDRGSKGINLNENIDDFVFAFSLHSNNLTNLRGILDHSITTHTLSSNSQDNLSDKNVNDLKIVRCSEINVTLFNDYFSYTELNEMFCLKNYSLFLKGDASYSDNSYLQIYLKKNQTYKITESYFLKLYMLDLNLSPDNFNLHKNTLRNFLLPISADDNEIWLFLKKLEIILDTGELFKDENSNMHYVYDKVFHFKSAPSTDDILNLKILISQLHETVKISYKKLYHLIADLGGLIIIFILTGEAVTFKFKSLEFESYLVDKFFTYKNLTENSMLNDIKHIQMKEKKLAAQKISKPSTILNKLQIINYSTVNKSSNITKVKNKKSKQLKVTFNPEISYNENKNISDFELDQSLNSSRQLQNCKLSRRENLSQITPYLFKIESNQEKSIKISKSKKDYRKKIYEDNYTSLKLSYFEIFCVNVFNCSTKFKTKKNSIELGKEKLMIKFDWINFIKSLNDLNLIKQTIFTSHQNNLISINLKSITPSNVYVKFKFKLIRFLGKIL